MENEKRLTGVQGATLSENQFSAVQKSLLKIRTPAKAAKCALAPGIAAGPPEQPLSCRCRAQHSEDGRSAVQTCQRPSETTTCVSVQVCGIYPQRVCTLGSAEPCRHWPSQKDEAPAKARGLSSALLGTCSHRLMHRSCFLPWQEGHYLICTVWANCAPSLLCIDC
jgi:hypothetical protein